MSPRTRRSGPSSGEPLVVLSHRLPFDFPGEPGRAPRRRNVGGLLRALEPVLAAHHAVWVGWEGRTRPSREVPAATDDPPTRVLGDGVRAVGVPLDERELYRHAHGACDRMLWPLLHGFLDTARFDPRDFAAYVAVNRRFARVADEVAGPDGRTWIHDFPLALVPAALRERGRTGRVDLFLHVPFPPPDLFRALPWREVVLGGLLAADTIGVQSERDRDHLAGAAEALCGARVRRVDGDLEVVTDARACRIHAEPVAIDVAAFEAASRDAAVRAEAVRLRRLHRGRPIVLAADRLDATKGILERFLAVEAWLRREPRTAGTFDLVQVVVPGRHQVREYRELRSRLDREVGRINGEWARDGWMPIHYRFRALSREDLVAHYLAATVAMVTPLRDGMNLVASEFVASRTDDDGVLVLSEFAGAVHRLDGALVVNPYDVDGTADALARALGMAPEERRRRMLRMRERVRERDAADWARRCLALPAPAVAGVRTRTGSR